jgi:hypothetical protein
MIPASPKGHLTNRRAFAGLDTRQPIVKLYCKLIALELSLKDFDAANFRRSHDVCDMAMKTFPSSSVAAAANTLRGDLATILCTGTRGAPTTVRAEKYPDLRYVRMHSDFAPPSSTEADILVSLTSFETLLQELRKDGLPWP